MEVLDADVMVRPVERPLELQLADKLRTEAEAYRYLEDMRWGDRPVCPHCGSVRKPYFLKPANGRSRKTTLGAASERRVWKCADCRKQFTVLTGTIFHGTKIPVRTWVFLIFEFASSKNGIAAREIERKYGLTPKSAWFAMQRLREAMKLEPIAGLLSGIVIADETWYGGKPSNRHGHKCQNRLQGQTGVHRHTHIVAQLDDNCCMMLQSPDVELSEGSSGNTRY
jgi:transposase-like protein